MSQGQH
ncbi:hypothetical protein CICLE_v100100072mg, partial [Citrus x clementina]